MKRIVFYVTFLSLLVMASCHSHKKVTDGTQEGTDLKQQLAGTWQLNYISGIRIAFEGLYPKKTPYLSFDFNNNHIGGNNSCNSFGAAFKMEGDTIRFSEFVQTMMACEGEGESTFNKMMQQVNTFTIKGDTLTFFKNDVAIMRFNRLLDK